jgi:outer membrane lipoprotein carrier protein
MATRNAFVVLALLPGPSRAQDPWPVLDRASDAYVTVSTLSADFVQVIVNPLLGAPDTTRGRLFLQPPARFAMRFTAPAGDRVVADGRHLWLYTPSTTPGQVIRTRVPATGATGPNLIAQFVDRPRERYEARYLRADSLPGGWTDAVVLVPKDEAAPYREAVIWVGRADGYLRRLEMVEQTGQRRVVTLSQLRVNQGVPAREFVFSPAAGTRIVDQ